MMPVQGVEVSSLNNSIVRDRGPCATTWPADLLEERWATGGRAL
jgi:hypothetical protein